MIILFSGRDGRLGYILTSQIEAVIQNETFIDNPSHPHRGYRTAVIMTKSGREINTCTSFEDIIASWRAAIE